MKVWLQTRGVAHDYAFLGAAPPDYWWTSPLYKDATSFEQPTLILERLRGNQWRCFISAIPSARRDRVNTRIRYSLALCGEGESDQETLLSLLGYLLDIFKNDPASEENPITRKLDSLVGDHIDEWLSNKFEDAQTCIDKVKKIFVELKPLTIESRKIKRLEKELQNLLKSEENSTWRVALLNFIGKRESPAADHLESQMEPSQGQILILPSPVAGGNIESSFLLGPQRNVSTTEGPNSPHVFNNKPDDRTVFYSTLSRAVAGLALVFLLIAGGAWLFNGTKLPAELAPVEQVATTAYHTDKGKLSEEGNVAQLTVWSDKILGRPVRPPDLSSAGYQLTGGQRVTTEQYPACMFSYIGRKGDHILLFVEALHDRKMTTSLQKMRQVPGYVWVQDGLGISMMADEPIAHLDDLAKHTRDLMAEAGL
ncbi:hypothetical protein Amal_03226 [Acetobacter malorum]|uniref:Transmembrane protein n=1 Tax=Acetobacter malorum TaxID=178901 RepID=A0A177G5Q9_9PROT|nr:hypothetical protein [Acetobacter malorum]OAG75612.1 hypothetical protein Amal_03226 [Acetobacter malorum]